MQSQTLVRSLAAGAVLVAAALVLVVARVPSDSATGVPAHAGSGPARIDTAVNDGSGIAAEPHDSPAAATVRELEAMSETFRNTTFVIAIRDAGYVCIELLRVYGGLDGSAKWLVSCSDMLAYTIGVAGNGTLHVEPTLQYMDGVTRGVRLIQPSDELVLPSPEPSRSPDAPPTR